MISNLVNYLFKLETSDSYVTNFIDELIHEENTKDDKALFEKIVDVLKSNYDFSTEIVTKSLINIIIDGAEEIKIKKYISDNFFEDLGSDSKKDFVTKLKSTNNDTLDNLGEPYTQYYAYILSADESVKKLKEYVDKYLVDIEDVKEEIKLINETITVLQTAIEQNKNDIQTVRLELINLINENYNLLKEYVDYNVEVLDDKITNIQIGAINVYNPTNGLLQPLQEVINSLYEISNKDGLSASEFDALDLTATAFDNYQITAYDFDSQGKTILA
jgi:hypothetical protein